MDNAAKVLDEIEAATDPMFRCALVLDKEEALIACARALQDVREQCQARLLAGIGYDKDIHTAAIDALAKLGGDDGAG